MCQRPARENPTTVASNRARIGKLWNIEVYQVKSWLMESVVWVWNIFQVSAHCILDQIQVDFSSLQLEKENEIDTFKYFADVLKAIESGSNNAELVFN